MEKLSKSGAEDGATYTKIKEYVKRNYSLNVSSLYIAQVKRKYEVISRENYNTSKKDNPRVPVCPPKKEECIIVALKYFRVLPAESSKLQIPDW